MSTNYAKRHAGSACSQEHLKHYHTPGYIHEGVDDANRERKSQALDDHPIDSQSQHRGLSGSEGPSQRNEASQNNLRRLKPSGQQNNATAELQSPPPRSEQGTGASQSALEYEPAHIANHNRYRPRNEPGEPGPVDRVVGLAEEFAGYVTENPSLEEKGKMRLEKGSKQD